MAGVKDRPCRTAQVAPSRCAGRLSADRIALGEREGCRPGQATTFAESDHRLRRPGRRR
ncbi:hypothetical protein ACRAWD_27365 [Caulobacter segnis]